MVSRARTALSSPPASIIETINDVSITVTARASTRVPSGSPSLCATTSAWWTAASTAATRAMPETTRTNVFPGRAAATPSSAMASSGAMVDQCFIRASGAWRSGTLAQVNPGARLVGASASSALLGLDVAVRDDLEVAPVERPEGEELLVGPVWMRRPCQPPAVVGAGVVGDEHPVLLQRQQDHPHPPAEAGDVHRLLEPDP